MVDKADGTYFIHLRSTNDIILLTNHSIELREMVDEFNTITKNIGLKINQNQLPRNINILLEGMLLIARTKGKQRRKTALTMKSLAIGRSSKMIGEK